MKGCFRVFIGEGLASEFMRDIGIASGSGVGSTTR